MDMTLQRAFRLVLLTSILLLRGSIWGESKRPIAPRDCVTVRDLTLDAISWQSTVWISPDGKLIAYLVRSPNLQTNANDIELHVLTLAHKDAKVNKPLLVGDISEARWASDSRHMLLLLRDGTKRAIYSVDMATGLHHRLFNAPADIVEYSADARLTTIVYATEIPEGSARHSPQESARGYRIAFPQLAEYAWPGRRVFVTRRSGNHWSAPKEIIVDSPLSGQRMFGFTHARNAGLNLSVAPNGGSVLISYFDFSERMPDEWRASEMVKLRERSGIIRALEMLVLYDLATGKCSVPFKTPWVTSMPVWSPDSRSILVAAMAPIGSQQEREDVASHALGHVSASRLFLVDVQDGRFEVVADHLAFAWEGALDWPQPDTILLRSKATNSIQEVVREDGVWHETKTIDLPNLGNMEVTTNGRIVLGSFSDENTPPELISYDPDSRQWRVLASLNLQFRELRLAPSREIHWETPTGYKATGILLLPPDYVEGRRYPLVIQTKPFAHGFACSFGDFPSFAPQPIADAGIMYLGAISTPGSNQREEDFYPQGYPGTRGTGNLAEAAFHMDLWDSAVDALDKLGLIDRDRVGVIGFSRTGWYTEFMLAHAKTHYRAATVADNVQYSVGEYWLHHDHDTMDSYDRLYGGPPYGKSLQNWLDYSVSFNLDKIQTPLLMEEMGNGLAYDDPNLIPVDLASSFEVFSGLNVLGKQVELYYYPNEDHTPDHPLARLATMQRNVDWYRFWLEGYERPDPEDPNQYARWRQMCEKLQQCIR